MKNTCKVLGFTAIIAAIAFNALLITGCPEPEPEGPTVESIAITKNPDKMQYTVGEKFDPTGMIVTATYSDGTTKEVTGYTFSGSFSADGAFQTTGPNGVTISFGGKNAVVNNINVTKAISSIAVTTPPTKTTYAIGEDLVITGLVVTATFSDNTTGPVAVTVADISGYDKTKAGSQTLTVTFGGKTATFTVTVQAAAAAADYVITGSGTAFTAKKGTTTVGDAEKPIADVITAIRTDAKGEAVTIQFGDGTTVLSIGTACVDFNNTGGSWGAVTLTGKITSANISIAQGTILINGGVSITSSADINNSYDSLFNNTIRNNNSSTGGALTITGGTVTITRGATIFNSSSGTVNITGGTVQATTSGQPVYNDSSGAINISGGTVKGTTSDAVINTSSSRGKITVSGGLVTSATTNATTGTIRLASGGSSTAVILEITGGTVENTSTTTGNAIYNASTGTVNITGGTVSKAPGGGYAIFNNGAGVITVGSGATVTGENQLVKP